MNVTYKLIITIVFAACAVSLGSTVLPVLVQACKEKGISMHGLVFLVVVIAVILYFENRSISKRYPR